MARNLKIGDEVCLKCDRSVTMIVYARGPFGSFKCVWMDGNSNHESGTYSKELLYRVVYKECG